MPMGASLAEAEGCAANRSKGSAARLAAGPAGSSELLVCSNGCPIAGALLVGAADCCEVKEAAAEDATSSRSESDFADWVSAAHRWFSMCCSARLVFQKHKCILESVL